MPRIFEKDRQINVIEYGDHCFQPLTFKGFWGAIRSLGRAGVAELVDRHPGRRRVEPERKRVAIGIVRPDIVAIGQPGRHDLHRRRSNRRRAIVVGDANLE